jgi:hypothetical protein
MAVLNSGATAEDTRSELRKRLTDVADTDIDRREDHKTRRSRRVNEPPRRLMKVSGQNFS